MSNLRTQTRRTVQSQVRQDRELGVGLLFNLVQAGEIIPPWWSRRRDLELTRFAVQSDHFQSAEWMISAKLTNVPFRVEPRDRSVKRHQKLANEYQAILENMLQFGDGWSAFWSPFFEDLWTTDNGAFGEILGPGNPGSARKGPAISIEHLDSLRCTRTSNPEYPVIYQDVDGKRYRFHHTRVIYASQAPSARVDMLGVGKCWLTRAINNTQQLVDQDVYYQEALGSRPIRQILLGRGVDSDDMVASVRRAEEGMDNQGLSRYSKTVFVGDRHRTDIGIDTIPFTFLPEGYDKQQQTSIAMFLIALAGGFPPRWLWPAPQAGATIADALYSHISGTGGGALWHLEMIRNLLSYTDRALAIASVLPPKFLPKELRLVFDYQDDEQDRQQAEIKDKRANTRKVDLESGVTTTRVSREQALASDDITEAQFNQMELEDGRLPAGADVLTLFDSLDPIIQELLDLGIEEPLLIDANDPIEMIFEIEAAALEAQRRMVQARSGAEKDKAEQALGALGKLKGIYEEIAGRQIEEEIAAEQQTGEFELPEITPEAEEETGETEEEAEGVETEEKGFDFGARVGERIRGGLFRGRGGKFASEGEVGAIKNEILARLIERLRAKRAAAGASGKKRGAAKKPKKGGGGKKKPSKEETQAKNRAKVFDRLSREFDIERNALNKLSDFAKGADLDDETAQRLAEFGLVSIEDGRVTLTSAGRALIGAANRGDERRALDVLAKAQPQDEEEETKQADEPPRGDFEQDITDDLQPVFRKAQVRTLNALQQGVPPDNEELREELIALFVPVLTDAAIFKFNMLEDQFALSFDSAETQAEAERWARQHAGTLVAGLLNTTQNIISGIDPDASQDEIEATVDRAFNEDRRERIGITETTNALIFGALLYQRIAAQRDVKIDLRWLTRLDERVCPICGPLHGTKQDVWSQQFPQGPPAHVRCRCDVIATRKR